jgi:GrpB-like predicted nucleotidyltransferase (UPF0157 family)
MGGMVLDERVILSDWRPEWATEFADLAEVLGEALGGIAKRIDHIDSTSVQGMRAKDVIDVQMIVSELESDRIIQAFGHAGFEQRTAAWNLQDHVPDGWVGNPEESSKLVFASPPRSLKVNVHVRRFGGRTEVLPFPGSYSIDRRWLRECSSERGCSHLSGVDRLS